MRLGVDLDELASRSTAFVVRVRRSFVRLDCVVVVVNRRRRLLNGWDSRQARDVTRKVLVCHAQSNTAYFLFFNHAMSNWFSS